VGLPPDFNALKQNGWDGVHFWRKIYDEVIEHTLPENAVNGEAEEIAAVEAAEAAAFEFNFELPTLPQMPQLPPEFHEAVNVTKQLMHIAFRELGSEPLSPVEIALGVGKLASIRDAERKAPRPNPAVPAMSAAEMRGAIRHAQMANAIYGMTGDEIAEAFGGVSLWSHGEPGKANFAVVRIGDEVVVVIQGSWGMEDALTCLDAMSVRFPPSSTDPAEYAHAGFVEAARRIHAEIDHILRREAMTARRITFTGHSLGGGVANVLAVMYNRRFRGRRVRVRSLGVAAPPALSPKLAVGANKICTNLVNSHDIVPRASIMAAQRLLKDLLELRDNEPVVGQMPRFERMAYAMLKDVQREEVVVQNGHETIRTAGPLAPLDFHHIEETASGFVMSKKPGYQLAELDLTRTGMVSDHIGARYISRLKQLYSDRLQWEQAQPTKSRFARFVPRGAAFHAFPVDFSSAFWIEH
jgi:pimeloyl-ACP methyl ester carboxylesterase